jgi:tRNA (Thr-GGU) A37 N-methylase
LSGRPCAIVAMRVSALEAIDGTPILDLKAVIAESRDE